MRASRRAAPRTARTGPLCLALSASLALLAAGLTAQTPLRAERSGPRPDLGPAASAPAWLDAGDPALLEAFLLETMQAKHIPGLQAAIVKDGGLYWSTALGLADPGLGLPVQEQTLFMLASISKTVTATALLQLVDAQLVGLDDPVGQHLPFAVQHPLFPGTDITLRMLLTHTSGLADNWGVMPYYPGDPSYPLLDYLRDYLTPGGALYDPSKSFHPWQPGSDYAYCNNGLALVGLVVEQVSGTAFPERCASALFEPLEMQDSAWMLADLDPAQVAMPCSWNGAGWTSYGHYGYADYPSGQLRTSAVQLARLLSMAIDDGRYGDETLLQASTVEQMLTQQVPGLEPPQGLAWYAWTVGGRSVWGHGGGDQGVTTEMWFDPVSDIGVVVLTNGESYVPSILDALFDHAEVFPPQTSLSADVASLSASLGGEVRFTIQGGSINAGRSYVLLGCLSGTSPGTPLPGGQVVLPLNWDPVTDLIVAAINTPMFSTFYAPLGAGGLGRAGWNTFGPLPPALAGHTLSFAAAFKGPWDYATNPVEIAITP